MAAAEVSTADLYGFPIKITAHQKAERDECDVISDRLQASWMECIEVQTLPRDSKLKEMVRKGVPPTVRTWVWMESSGAAAKKAKHANNYYTIMVAAGQSSPFRKDIEQDVSQTFPSHPWLSSSDGHEALARVLLAYSAHNDKLGYCRAMNDIVAMLLVAMNRNQENAFWLLAALVEDHLYPGTYSSRMEGCQVEMEALDELISQKLPRLHAHLRATDTDIALMATDWYLCLYSTSLPSETVLRIWDALYNEGPKILFRVAIAMLQMNEQLLLSKNNAGDILMTMRKVAGSMHNREALMHMAFDGIGSLSMSTIDRLRLQREAEVRARVAAGRSGGAAPPPQEAPRADAPKSGFGRFMGGLTKLVDRTKEEMNKLALPDNGVPPPAYTSSTTAQAGSASRPGPPTTVSPALHAVPPSVSPAAAGHAVSPAAASAGASAAYPFEATPEAGASGAPNPFDAKVAGGNPFEGLPADTAGDNPFSAADSPPGRKVKSFAIHTEDE